MVAPGGAPLILLCFVVLLVGGALGVASQNHWGWYYDNGAPLPRERRVNIVASMLSNGANAAASALFVKCSRNTVYKWWRRWQQTGSVEVLVGRRGPAPVIGPAALLYLICLSDQERTYSLYQYRQRLLQDIGLDASEYRICAALKRAREHRKKTSIRKLESLTVHARILRQRYRLTTLGLRLNYGIGAINLFVTIDEI
jgi:transposase